MVFEATTDIPTAKRLNLNNGLKPIQGFVPPETKLSDLVTEYRTVVGKVPLDNYFDSVRYSFRDKGYVLDLFSSVADEYPDLTVGELKENIPQKLKDNAVTEEALTKIFAPSQEK